MCSNNNNNNIIQEFRPDSSMKVHKLLNTLENIENERAKSLATPNASQILNN